MNATPIQTAEATDAGFTVVGRDEFFKALSADPCDVMPNNDNRNFTIWRNHKGVGVFGKTIPGDPQVYMLAKK